MIEEEEKARASSRRTFMRILDVDPAMGVAPTCGRVRGGVRAVLQQDPPKCYIRPFGYSVVPTSRTGTRTTRTLLQTPLPDPRQPCVSRHSRSAIRPQDRAAAHWQAAVPKEQEQLELEHASKSRSQEGEQRPWTGSAVQGVERGDSGIAGVTRILWSALSSS